MKQLLKVIKISGNIKSFGLLEIIFNGLEKNE